MDRRSVSELTVDELVAMVTELVMQRLRDEAEPAKVTLPAKRYSRRRIRGDASRKWGYEFGVDGTLNEIEVRNLLGEVSASTLLRRVAAGLIRKGKDGRRIVYCRHSVRNYLATLER